MMTTDKATVTGIKKNKETPKKAERANIALFFYIPKFEQEKRHNFCKKQKNKKQDLTKELK